jgi:hypothetical protein
MVPKKGLKIPKRYSLIRIPKSKDRQHNGQMKRDKRTNNNLPNNTQITMQYRNLIGLATRWYQDIRGASSYS